MEKLFDANSIIVEESWKLSVKSGKSLEFFCFKPVWNVYICHHTKKKKIIQICSAISEICSGQTDGQMDGVKKVYLLLLRDGEYKKTVAGW